MTAPEPKRLANRRQRLDRNMRANRAEANTSRREAAQARRGQPARKVSRLAPAVERLLLARAAGRCELCGDPFRTGRCHRHHRKLRAQGGRDDVTNLVLLHPGCHLQIIHGNPMWAKENGWMISAAHNPATVPIFLHNTRRVRLSREGNYEQVAA